jgi:hypothetical protein
VLMRLTSASCGTSPIISQKRKTKKTKTYSLAKKWKISKTLATQIK